MESPPTRIAALRLVYRPSSLTTLAVCRASSRVGERMTERDPALVECSFSLQNQTLWWC